jgi:hypothetical protein
MVSVFVLRVFCLLAQLAFFALQKTAKTLPRWYNKLAKGSRFCFAKSGKTRAAYWLAVLAFLKF